MRLSEHDRGVIERGLQEGLTVPQIAAAIGRHRTAVAREINRVAGSRPERACQRSCIRT